MYAHIITLFSLEINVEKKLSVQLTDFLSYNEIGHSRIHKKTAFLSKTLGLMSVFPSVRISWPLEVIAIVCSN